MKLIRPLGGRFNQHWLVNFRGEQLVLRRWWLNSAPDIDYELRLLTSIAKLGWPVAPAVNEPIELNGYFWCLFPYLSGDPPPVENRMMEQRTRGELLAKFHTSLAQLTGFEQRGNWRRCEEILGDFTLDRILSDNERKRPEEMRILRWHLDRARKRIIGLKPHMNMARFKEPTEKDYNRLEKYREALKILKSEMKPDAN